MTDSRRQHCCSRCFRPRPAAASPAPNREGRREGRSTFTGHTTGQVQKLTHQMHLLVNTPVKTEPGSCISVPSASRLSASMSRYRRPYVEPVYGRSRRIQGTVIEIDSQRLSSSTPACPSSPNSTTSSGPATSTSATTSPSASKPRDVLGEPEFTGGHGRPSRRRCEAPFAVWPRNAWLCVNPN